MSIDYPIPVIVKDLLAKLHSPLLDTNEKDNIVTTVEQIARACSKEAEDYRKARALDFEDARKNKRRQGSRR